MHWRSALTVGVVAVLWAGCASQPARKQPPPHNIPLEVRAEFDQSAMAWNSGDFGRFISIYSNEATFALPDGYLQGRVAIREYYAPLFQPGATRDTLSFEEIRVDVLSSDFVLVRAVYRNSQNGQVVRRGTSTLILRWEADTWRVIHDHSS
jgi:uncharacterized protein (TIGR02246 family)